MSPCGCTSTNTKVTLGYNPWRHVQVGLGYNRFRTLDRRTALTLDAVYYPLLQRHLEVRAATGVVLWRKPDHRNDDVDYEQRGTLHEIGIAYRPWAHRRHAKAWTIYAGYAYESEVQKWSFNNGDNGSKITSTHIGWQLRIGYSLYRSAN